MGWTNNESSTSSAGSAARISGGVGTTVASASSITISDFITPISGAVTINTISGPLSGEIFVLDSIDGFSLGTSGNIQGLGATLSVPAGNSIVLTMRGSTVHSSAEAFMDSSLVFNVVTYGAVGDGATDDSAAIQAAIDAAEAAGGVVYFPVGIYKLLTGLTVTKTIKLTGASGFRGDGTTGLTSRLRTHADITAITFTNKTASGSSLSDLTITPNSGQTSTLPGVNLINTTDTTIERCFIGGLNPSGGSAGFAVGVQYEGGAVTPFSSFDNCIRDSAIVSNATSNIYLMAATNSLRLFNVTFGGVTQYGVRCVDSNGLNIFGGNCEGGTVCAVELDATDAAHADAAHLICGVHFESSPASGGTIRVGNTAAIHGVTLIGNYWSANGAPSAVHLVRGGSVSIVGGTLHTGFTSGWLLVESTFTGHYSVLGVDTTSNVYANTIRENFHTQDRTDTNLFYQAPTFYDAAVSDYAQYNLLRLKTGSLTQDKNYYAGIDAAYLRNDGALPTGIAIYARRLAVANNVSAGTNLRSLIADAAIDFNRYALTYSTSITPPANQGNYFTLTVTDGVAFAMNAPVHPVDGQEITFTIRNTSGGVMGAITWNAVFKMAAFTNPANGYSRSISFLYDGTNWVETTRGAADIPN